jgi:hypothetical protein
LKLFNYFSPLHDSSTSLEDEIFNPPDEEYLELPKQGVSIASVDIDVGTGQMRARQKLEKKKASTTQGKVVTSIEKDWSQSSIQNTRSAIDILRIHDSQCQQRTSLRDFYYSNKHVRAKRSLELQDAKFRRRFCSLERKKLLSLAKSKAKIIIINTKQC